MSRKNDEKKNPGTNGLICPEILKFTTSLHEKIFFSAQVMIIVVPGNKGQRLTISEKLSCRPSSWAWVVTFLEEGVDAVASYADFWGGGGEKR